MQQLTLCPPDGSRQPTEKDLKVAKVQGKEFGESESRCGMCAVPQLTLLHSRRPVHPRQVRLDCCAAASGDVMHFASNPCHHKEQTGIVRATASLSVFSGGRRAAGVHTGELLLELRDKLVERRDL
jgi:hypothetical protein